MPEFAKTLDGDYKQELEQTCLVLARYLRTYSCLYQSIWFSVCACLLVHQLALTICLVYKSVSLYLWVCVDSYLSNATKRGIARVAWKAVGHGTGCTMLRYGLSAIAASDHQLACSTNRIVAIGHLLCMYPHVLLVGLVGW
jgi:hypothetical protein